MPDLKHIIHEQLAYFELSLFNGPNVNCFLLLLVLLATFIIQQHLFSLISGSLDSGQCQNFVLLISLLMIVKSNYMFS